MKKVPVIVAIGLDVRDWSIATNFLTYLNANATKVAARANRWTKKLPAKNLEYEIAVVYEKKAFAKALDKEGAIVIYDGHSRYGQGPVFGPASLGHCPSKAVHPKNPWEDNFRMGWDTISIPCVEDIFDHCTNPTEFPHRKAPRGFFAKKIVKTIVAKAHGRRGECDRPGYRKRKLLTCNRAVARRSNGRGDKTLLARHYWYPRGSDFHTLVQVGRADLDKSSLKCSVLFMNSCSSKGHFYYALRKRKRAAKSKCSFYVTRRVCSAATSEEFLKVLFRGLDPKGRTGHRRFLRAMSIADSGFIQYLN